MVDGRVNGKAGLFIVWWANKDWFYTVKKIIGMSLTKLSLAGSY